MKITYSFPLLLSIKSQAQYYSNILNYAIKGTPTNGVQIKTNIPFAPITQMPTINIMSYSYGTNEPINLTLSYYIYSKGSNFNDPANFYVYQSKVSSSSSYTPTIYLSNENGNVIIYINDRIYYQRFTVSIYANGMAEQASWFTGWTAFDEVLTGTETVEVP